MPRYLVNPQVEEQRRHRASLSNTGVHTEAGFGVSPSALEVGVEALDDKDDLLWNSICPEYAPYRPSRRMLSKAFSKSLVVDATI